MTVPHRSVHLGHCRTVRATVERRVPHPSHLIRPLRRVQLTKTRPPRIGIWLKGKKVMLWTQSRHTLTRCGMHFRNTHGSITSAMYSEAETITIQSVLEKAVSPDMTKRILKSRTQMVESIYKYFDPGLSESHRPKLYIWTYLDPRFKNYNIWPTHKYVTIHTYAHRVCSVAKLNDRGWTRLTCFFFDRKKYNLQWVFQELREVWTKDFKEDPFEKELRLVNETRAEQLRVSRPCMFPQESSGLPLWCVSCVWQVVLGKIISTGSQIYRIFFFDYFRFPLKNNFSNNTKKKWSRIGISSVSYARETLTLGNL